MKSIPMVPQDQPPAPEETHETDGLVADPAKTGELREPLQRALKTVFDPEIPVDIWELGLIYDVFVTADGVAAIRMTLTAPACPVAGTLPGEVERKVEEVAEVKSAKVELVWDPPWSRDMMSESAMLTLGMY